MCIYPYRVLINVECKLQELHLLLLYKPILALAEKAWCDALHITPQQDHAAVLRFQAHRQYLLWHGNSFRRNERGPVTGVPNGCTGKIRDQYPDKSHNCTPF